MFEYLSQFFSQIFLEAISDEIDEEEKETSNNNSSLPKPKSLPIIIDCTNSADLSNLRKSVSFSNYINSNEKYSLD